jgi:hypothetical protein
LVDGARFFEVLDDSEEHIEIEELD